MFLASSPITSTTTSTWPTRAFTHKFSLPYPTFSAKTRMESPPRSLHNAFLSPASPSPQRKPDSKDPPSEGGGDDGFALTLQEWQGWGTVSPVPAKVLEVIEDLKLLERNIDAQMSFGGHKGKLQGDFGILEDKKHRATYEALGDSEKKLQFFSARQIACRLLGSRGYLCQKCWLPLEYDCMCSKLEPCSLWNGIRFWLYMHPKDFLRQNNTGKLLWQVFGVRSATLCLYGITEHEEFMWNELKLAGKGNVWCLYPNKNVVTKSVHDALGPEISSEQECSHTLRNGDKPLNFILLDGTWSNATAMFNRLKDKTESVWGEPDLPCISLSIGASTMHKLRPQPSWDRTCTAAAAMGLLSELQVIPEFRARGLTKPIEALEEAIHVLLEALTTRRLRMGRSITRKDAESGLLLMLTATINGNKVNNVTLSAAILYRY
ncbi:hypothetical protein Tsubulata_047067 [Turnera subulata]|uniref:tRNA-uridine aminocarboxypropyltransferase n=1 Tax=Turnera subulata TaxID=218843 RepID=A0A9Q0J0Z3_9ROSI|nr:hypothetical protein Tsubulata_047067 [Turnera subulata]